MLDNNVKVKILSNIAYQTYPEVDGMVLVDKDLLSRIGIDKQFDKDGNIVDFVNYYKKIDELKQNLSNTDYVSNKLAEAIATSFVTGDNSSVTALRNKYFNILADRDAWREEINRLEEELKNGNQ